MMPLLRMSFRTAVTDAMASALLTGVAASRGTLRALGDADGKRRRASRLRGQARRAPLARRRDRSGPAPRRAPQAALQVGPPWAARPPWDGLARAADATRGWRLPAKSAQPPPLCDWNTDRGPWRTGATRREVVAPHARVGPGAPVLQVPGRALRPATPSLSRSP